MDDLIEIDAQVNVLRKELPEAKELDEARRLLCQAQNVMQKHIEKIFPPSQWKHTRTTAPVQSSYGLTPE